MTRVAVATDDGRTIAAHTGRCQGFVIFDIQDGQAQRGECRANTFTGHAQGQCTGHQAHAAEAGHHSHGPLLAALADCQVLIARGLGPRLVHDLARQGIDVHVCAVESADEAATLFAAGALPRIAGTGCCHGGAGH